MKAALQAISFAVINLNFHLDGELLLGRHIKTDTCIVVSKSAILCTVRCINMDIPKNVQVPYYGSS